MSTTSRGRKGRVCVSKKRSRDAGNGKNGVGKNGAGKRRRVDEDLIYYYGDDDDANAVEHAEKRYIILSQDDIRARQEADTAEVADVLSISPGIAAVLLRHYKWRAMRVQEEWFSTTGGRHIRDAVGLPPDGVLVPMALSRKRKRLVCGICFRRLSARRMRSASCSTHFYCDECWRGYIHAAIENGPGCLSLRCPDPSCSAAVVRELVDKVADAEEKARYAQFALWSFVDESGGRIKWCPGRGCTRAVEFVGGAGDDAATDVICECTHAFCWGCGEEPHRPVSCDTVRAWLAKSVASDSEAETTNWVLKHTKLCPMCRRPIQKSYGCDHMTCRAPCHHEFCWLCLDPWGSHFRCSPTMADAQRNQRQQEAKASQERYEYYYERWESNTKLQQKALADMDELKRSTLKDMAASLEVQVEELEFLTMAYEMIAHGRRVMRWVYAYGYYLDPESHAAKRRLFEHLQDDANKHLENLHHSAEVERVKLFSGGEAGSAMTRSRKKVYRAYKDQLVKLTKVTRNYFGNLVKAFETDLPEFSAVKNS